MLERLAWSVAHRSARTSPASSHPDTRRLERSTGELQQDGRLPRPGRYRPVLSTSPVRKSAGRSSGPIGAASAPSRCNIPNPQTAISDSGPLQLLGEGQEAELQADQRDG